MVTTAPQEHLSVVHAAVAGDETAFRQLYDSYARSIFNMVLRSVRDAQLAEDISQEVWLKAHRQLGKLREPGAFPAWLYRIAAKACIDAARRRARRPEGDPLDDAICGGSHDPERRAIAREDAQRVWEALAALPPHQHLALFLREVEQLPYREIANVLRISETAAGLCLLRARRSFAATYSRVDEQDAPSRCKAMQRVISLHIDGQATVVQTHALNAHITDCAGCRLYMGTLRQASQHHAALLFLPVPLLMQSNILASKLPADAVAATSLGKAGGALFGYFKVAAITASVVGGGAIVAPHALETIAGSETVAIQRPVSSAGDSPAVAQPAGLAPAPAAAPVRRELGTAASPPASESAAAPDLVDDVTSKIPAVDATGDDAIAQAADVVDSTIGAVDSTIGAVETASGGDVDASSGTEMLEDAQGGIPPVAAP